jgi:hypothetical protein
LPLSDLPLSDLPPSLLALLLVPPPLDVPPLPMLEDVPPEVPEVEGVLSLAVLDSGAVEDEVSAFIAFFLDSDG